MNSKYIRRTLEVKWANEKITDTRLVKWFELVSRGEDNRVTRKTLWEGKEKVDRSRIRDRHIFLRNRLHC